MIVVKNINNNVSLCLDSSNLQMYETMRQEYKAVADCVDKIGEYYESVTSAEFSISQRCTRFPLKQLRWRTPT